MPRQKETCYGLSLENFLTHYGMLVHTADVAFSILRPRQMAIISQTPFSNAFLHFLEWKGMNFYFKKSVKFVRKDPINHIPAFVKILAWCRPGDKPLSETMVVRLQTYICVTRPQCVSKSTCHVECRLSRISEFEVCSEQLKTFLPWWFIAFVFNTLMLEQNIILKQNNWKYRAFRYLMSTSQALLYSG